MIRILPLCLLAAVCFLAPARPALAVDPVRDSRPDPEPVPEDTALETQLATQYGADFLPRLKEMGVTPKDYVYAARLTQVGIQKVQESDFQDARYLLDKAYSIVPSPNLLYWIGLTHLGLDEPVRARAYFVRFLAEAGAWRLTQIKPDLLALTRAEIVRIEKTLSWLKLAVSHPDAKIYLDGEFVGKSPLTAAVPLTQGRHQLIIIKPGFARHTTRLTPSEAGQILHETVTLYTEAEQIRNTKLFRDTEARRIEALRRYDETRRKMRLEAEQRRAVYGKYARVTLISGAVLATAALTFGILTLYYDDKVENAPQDTPWKELSADQNKADFFRTTTIAALGATVLCVGASTWLTQLAIPPRDGRSRVSITPLASPSAFGLQLGFRF